MSFEEDRDWTVAPGELLQEWMDERGVTVRMMALMCGRAPVSAIETILNKGPISPDLALALGRATQIPPQFWMTLEETYRRDLARGRKD